MTIAWEEIFAALEAAYEETASRSAEGAPSVTAIARDMRGDPWAVLVSTILSLRTKDAVTFATSRRLLEKAPTPALLLDLTEEQVASLAYPSGFYRTKARSLLSIAEILIERYGGHVPSDRDALLALPGVGLKTANLVLVEAFDKEAICVDVHVHRIANRMGWIRTAKPDESEAALRAALPRRYWKRVNALLVSYGQSVCAPVSPRCSICRLSAYCGREGVNKSR